MQRKARGMEPATPHRATHLGMELRRELVLVVVQIELHQRCADKEHPQSLGSLRPHIDEIVARHDVVLLMHNPIFAGGQRDLCPFAALTHVHWDDGWTECRGASQSNLTCHCRARHHNNTTSYCSWPIAPSLCSEMGLPMKSERPARCWLSSSSNSSTT